MSPATPPPFAASAASLPVDADGVLKLAAQSMFDTLAATAMGMMVVDREHRIVWISEGYKSFLPALGFGSAQEFVGRRVEEVIPNTLLGEVIETGDAILVEVDQVGAACHTGKRSCFEQGGPLPVVVGYRTKEQEQQ